MDLIVARSLSEKDAARREKEVRIVLALTCEIIGRRRQGGWIREVRAHLLRPDLQRANKD